MGLTKQYLRYTQQSVFNLVGGHKPNVIFFGGKSNSQTSYCATGACEHVYLWDFRKGEKVMTLRGSKYEVSRLVASPDCKHIAVGYTDGTVNIFNISSGEISITFSGHKSQVTALNYDFEGMRLVSGAKDKDVIIWDIVNESGLYRLKGHKDMITQARFLHKHNVLITSSKDTLVKFWDLDVQHCYLTLVNHTTEVWDFVVCLGDSRLVTGCGDMDLRIFELTLNRDYISAPTTLAMEVDGEAGEGGAVRCSLLGSIQRFGKDRVTSLATDLTGHVIACHGRDKQLELFELLTEDELRTRLLKKQRKARKKATGVGEGVGVELTVNEMIRRVPLVRLSAKIRSIDVLKSHGHLQAVCLLNNNSLELCTVDPKAKAAAVLINLTTILQPGHRTDARAVCFTSDDLALATGSGDSVKVWNRTTSQCIRTVACEYILGLVFAPGDRHIIAAAKSGSLLLLDVGGATVVETIQAHSGAVSALLMAPSKRSMVTGSSDKTVKFWDFEFVKREESRDHLTLVHTRTLQLEDEVLCVSLSADSRLIAVALLDQTVKVFFLDTLRLSLSLYGHKLPVICMDMSTDCSLIATGSADRNVKLWGLDFGDCHKSIFAHDDSVMALQFVPKTHMFFTAGKDGKVKQWDGDNFQLIQILKGHHAEVWTLAVSPNGRHVATASHDKSIRVWDKSEEIVVLSEEREMEREAEAEEEEGARGDTGVVAGEGTGAETGAAARKTGETVRSAEKILEALQCYREEPYKDPSEPKNPMLIAYGVNSSLEYLREVLKRIKSSEVEPSLLVLPFPDVLTMLNALNEFLKRGYDTELTCRCVFFLLRIHQGQITSSQLAIVEDLRTHVKKAVRSIRDPIGYNLAALNVLKKHIEDKSQITLFHDAVQKNRDKKKKKDKQRAILVVT